MRKQHFKLRRPDLSAQLEERYRKEKDARNKVGAHASQDIADICGVSRATFFEWAKSFREGEFDALLEREKPGPKGMKLRGVPEAMVKELRAGVESGRWTSTHLAPERVWHQTPVCDGLVMAKKIRRAAASAAAQTPRK